MKLPIQSPSNINSTCITTQLAGLLPIHFSIRWLASNFRFELGDLPISDCCLIHKE